MRQGELNFLYGLFSKKNKLITLLVQGCFSITNTVAGVVKHLPWKLETGLQRHRKYEGNSKKYQADVILAKEGVAKSIKALHYKEHQEELFFSFVYFVPLWFPSFQGLLLRVSKKA